MNFSSNVAYFRFYLGGCRHSVELSTPVTVRLVKRGPGAYLEK